MTDATSTTTATPEIEAVEHPARRRLPLIANLTAAFFSLGGNAIALVAIPIIALTQTGSPLAAGVVGVFATVPLVIGGAFGGGPGARPLRSRAWPSSWTWRRS